VSVLQRIKTKYPNVYYIIGKNGQGRSERIYYIRYRKNGKQVEEKVGRQFKDAMTEAKANNVLSDKNRGLKLPNNEKRKLERISEEEKENIWTVDRLWEEYKRNHSPKGISIDDGRFKKYIQPEFGDKDPKDIVTLDVTRLNSRMKKRGLKPGTIGRTLEVFRRTIRFGVDQELIPPAPFKITLPRANDEKTEYLTRQQLSKLWKVLGEEKNQQVANMMKLVLYTGLRRGELFKLKWDHLDFENGFINLVDPKGKVDQKIPMSGMARELLKNHYKVFENGPFVFPGKDGNQLTNIKRPVKRIKETAGLPADFRPLHGLRHTYATLLASSGKVDIYTLQKLLTHKDPKTTQRYAHLLDETVKKASRVAEDIISEMVLTEENMEKVL